MQCPRCQQENPSQARFCMGCGAALRARARAQKARVGPRLPVSQRKAPKKEGGRVRDLEKRLTEALAQLQTRDRELVEALDQQRATSDILRVISGSPTDVQPVFDTIVRSAVRLCDGVFSIVGHFDGEYIHFGAHYNFDQEALAAYRRWFPRRAPTTASRDGRSSSDGS